MIWTRTSNGVLAGLSAVLLGCSPAALPAGHTLNDPALAPPTRSPDPESADSGSEQAGQRGRNAEQPVADEITVTYGPAPPPPPRISVPPAQMPAGGQTIGQPGPIALEAMSPAGHWLAYCQPEAGGPKPESPIPDPRTSNRDHIALFVHFNNHEVPIEGLLRADAEGRYLVVLIDGSAWLIDAVQDARWDLSSFKPDLRHDGLSEHRSFAFTENALLILSESPSDSGKIVAIDLSDLRAEGPLSSIELSAEEQTVYRLEATESHVSTISLPKNSTTKYWPGTHQTSPRFRCLDRGRRFAAYSRLSAHRPDQYISYSWLRLPRVEPKANQSRFEPAPGFVFGFRDGWVRRLDNGRLMLVRHRTQQQIASERCGARILHADEATGKFLIACEEYEPVIDRSRKESNKKQKPKYRFELYLIKPGLVRSLGADMARTGVDVRGLQGGRYLPIRPGAGAALVDFEQANLLNLDGDASVIAVGSAGILLKRGSALSLWRGATIEEEQLLATASPLEQVLHDGPVAALGSQVFDLRGSMRSWDLPQTPLAITKKGYALVSGSPRQKGSSMEGSWVEGPLVLIPPPEPTGTNVPMATAGNEQ